MPEKLLTAAPAKPRKPRAPRNPFNEHARRLVQLAMAIEGVSYKGLARLLKDDDPTCDESAVQLTRRINRGTFTFAFALQVCRVLRVSTLDLTRVMHPYDRKPAGKP